MNTFIKWLGYEDYFYVIKKNEEYNTTGKTELHTLNSDNYIKIGKLNIFIYLLKYRLELI